jgi:allophanate hydrolase subunit 1
MTTLLLHLKSCIKILTVSLIVVACADKKDPNIEAAIKIHNEASAIAAGIETQIEAIDSLQTLLIEKKKTLGNAAPAAASIDSTVAALAAVATAFESWEQNIIEVPGMVHDDSAGEHHHDHKPAPHVTSAQMLEIQKEMKANIEKIKSDFTRAEAMLNAVMN